MFNFGRKRKAPASRGGKPAPEAGQKRSMFRMPVEFDVVYTLDGRHGRRRGRAADLSAGGVRLATDEDFLKGSELALEFSLPADFLDTMTIEKEVYEQTPFGLRPETMRVQPPGFAPMHVRARVLVTFYDLETHSFGHGTTFFDIDEKSQEELQRFIHLWQLNDIRTRRSIVD